MSYITLNIILLETFSVFLTNMGGPIVSSTIKSMIAHYLKLKKSIHKNKSSKIMILLKFRMLMPRMIHVLKMVKVKKITNC